MARPSCRESYELEEPLYDGEEVVIEEGATLIRTHGLPGLPSHRLSRRVGIFEAVIVDDDLRELVKKKASPRELSHAAPPSRRPQLAQNGLSRNATASPPADEVLRVTT